MTVAETNKVGYYKRGGFKFIKGKECCIPLAKSRGGCKESNKESIDSSIHILLLFSHLLIPPNEGDSKRRPTLYERVPGMPRKKASVHVCQSETNDRRLGSVSRLVKMLPKVE